MLTYILIASVSALTGVVFTAWRLRGDRSTAEAVRAVILGAGGAGPRKPW